MKSALLAALAGALIAGPAAAQGLAAIGPGVIRGIDGPTLESVLEPRCDTLTVLEPDTARFPLAADSERHLVCDGLQTVAGPRMDRAVFVIADGVLAFVNVQGQAATIDGTGDPAEFLGYQVWMDDLIAIHPDSDTGWALTEAGAHANLFAWRHPALDGEALVYAPLDFEWPAEARLGESFETLAPEIEAACEFTRTFNPDPGLPTGNTSQTQIDCFGYEVAGFPRKIEFVFGDGRLELAWILTGDAEEDRLRTLLTGLYGEAINPMPGMEIFPDHNIALRTDTPEILLVSDAVLDAYFGAGE